METALTRGDGRHRTMATAASKPVPMKAPQVDASSVPISHWPSFWGVKSSAGSKKYCARLEQKTPNG